jgi:hypothetical protein
VSCSPRSRATGPPKRPQPPAPAFNRVRGGDDEAVETRGVELEGLEYGLRAITAVDEALEVPLSGRSMVDKIQPDSRIEGVPSTVDVVLRVRER